MKNELTEFFDYNAGKYNAATEHLNERMITYDDMNQLIAYLPEDKSAILSHNILHTLSSQGLPLKNEYKHIIENISLNPSIGVVCLPAFVFNDKPVVVMTQNMTYDQLVEKFFPNLDSEQLFIETYDSHKFFNKVLYTLYFVPEYDTFHVRYANINLNN